MQYTLIIVLVFRLIGYGWGQECPNGSMPYTEEQICIYPVDAAAPYTTARVLCVQLGGAIFEINGDFDNTMAQAQAINALGKDIHLYIGLVRGKNDTWILDDGQPANYFRWDSGQPTSEGDCVTMNAGTGWWKTEYCATSTNFVCSIPMAYTKCADGWVGYKGSCYFIHDAQLQTMNGTYNASTAAALCRTQNAYLTSIHSEDEFLFIQSQIATSRPNDDCRQSAALIGLTCLDSNYIWQDFTQLNLNKTGSQCSAAYTMMNDPASCPDQTNTWNYWHDYSDFYRYICKKPSNGANIVLKRK